jgi:hypothetical protein
VTTVRNRFNKAARRWIGIGPVILAVLLSFHCKDDPARPQETTKDPAIVLSSGSVVFNVVRSSAIPGAKFVAVSNGGGGTLSGLAVNVTYSAQSAPTAPAWLQATLNQTTAPATISLSLLTTDMAVATYTATVSVSADKSSITARTIQVTCTVSGTGTPAIALSRTTVGFAATAGGANPAVETVTITNGGAGSLTGLGASINYQGGQPTGWLSRSLSPTTAPSTLTLNATTGSLAAGTYNATVSVSSPVAGNSPQTVAVTFTVSSAPPTTGSIQVNVATSGQNLDPTGYVVEVSVGGGFSQSTNVNTNGYVVISNLAVGAHTVTLKDVAANCVVGGSNPRTVTVVAGTTVETTFNVNCSAPATRSVTLVNNMNSGLNLQQVVQFKVAATEGGVYTRSDLLTDDPAQCLNLPGEAIDRGASRTFDITVGSNYSVYIGIGIWDLDNVFCPLYYNWFKRRYFTDPSFNTYYVWVVVNVTGHNSGNWQWTITGSYLNGTLQVTPAGNPGIHFNVTAGNPIP